MRTLSSDQERSRTLEETQQNLPKMSVHELEMLLAVTFVHVIKNWCCFRGGPNYELHHFTDADFIPRARIRHTLLS